MKRVFFKNLKTVFFLFSFVSFFFFSRSWAQTGSQPPAFAIGERTSVFGASPSFLDNTLMLSDIGSSRNFQLSIETGERPALFGVVGGCVPNSSGSCQFSITMVPPPLPIDLSSVAKYWTQISGKYQFNLSNASGVLKRVPYYMISVNPAAAFSMSSSGNVLCGLGFQQAVRCWGDSQSPQFKVPQNLGVVVSVSLGMGHACALNLDGQVKCWGDNSYGQATVPKNLPPAAAIFASDLATCALSKEGKATCWGNIADSPSIAGLLKETSKIVSLSALSMSPSTDLCGLTTEGQVKCWGDSPIIPPSGLANVISLSSNANQNSLRCALLNNGSVSCWGSSLQGVNPGAQVPSDLPFAFQVSTGQDHACALVRNGQVECWGDDSFGQTAVPKDLPPAIALVSRRYSTCALTNVGGVRCWGSEISEILNIPAGSLIY